MSKYLLGVVSNAVIEICVTLSYAKHEEKEIIKGNFLRLFKYPSLFFHIFFFLLRQLSKNPFLLTQAKQLTGFKLNKHGGYKLPHEFFGFGII